ncbi:hypothetical protein RRG08_048293 [Elysia crispata]|uniref:Uncharacterized protein n=1 Tax=Elysia crispata TaxID=231223 RepID=A0AAE0ZTK2_9GAST|nr:hypothetical protein RRG08_048293 [Elysia crispata]
MRSSSSQLPPFYVSLGSHRIAPVLGSTSANWLIAGQNVSLGCLPIFPSPLPLILLHSICVSPSVVKVVASCGPVAPPAGQTVGRVMKRYYQLIEQTHNSKDETGFKGTLTTGHLLSNGFLLQ